MYKNCYCTLIYFVMKVWCHFDFEDGLRGHKSLVQVLV